MHNILLAGQEKRQYGNISTHSNLRESVFMFIKDFLYGKIEKEVEEFVVHNTIKRWETTIVEPEFWQGLVHVIVKMPHKPRGYGHPPAPYKRITSCSDNTMFEN